MTQHNITGSEAFLPKDHVVIRQFARSRSGWFWLLAVTAGQFIVCSLVVLLVWAMIG